jgi:hypothetical protein
MHDLQASMDKYLGQHHGMRGCVHEHHQEHGQ